MILTGIMINVLMFTYPHLCWGIPYILKFNSAYGYTSNKVHLKYFYVKSLSGYSNKGKQKILSEDKLLVCATIKEMFTVSV